MKTIIFILFASVFAISSSCSQKEKKMNKPEAIEKQGSHHHIEISEIELNDGKKWLIEPKMMKILREIEGLILAENGTSMETYKDFAEKLSAKLNQLTSSCTMEGKAHDELHKWLVPFINQVNEFSELKSIEQGKVFHENFKSEFKRFNTYFE